MSSLELYAKELYKDNVCWHEDINGPYSKKYWNAVDVDIETLDKRMWPWEILDIHKNINVLQPTWDLKLKLTQADTNAKLVQIPLN